MSTESPVPEPTPPRTGASPALLATILGVVAIVALTIAGVAFLGGGDDVGLDEEMAVDGPGPSDGSEPTAEDLGATTEPGDAFLPAVTTEPYLARDPFSPVVPEGLLDGGDASTPAGTSPPVPGPNDAGQPPAPVEGVQPPPSGDPPPPGTAPPPPTTGSPPPPGPGAAPPPGSSPPPAGADRCRGETEVVCDGRVVTLSEIARSADGDAVALIQVDQTTYEVAPGQTFASWFHLGAIEGGCASLLYGDEGFVLCEGDRVLK